MTLNYTNYNNINPKEELAKIELATQAEINIEPTNKECLFILGMLFANGVKIKILNEKELNLTETNKSFQMMSYVWRKLSDDNFPNKDYSNVITEMDIRIENIKRLNINVEKIINSPIENKMFLICPVRNATNEQRELIENYVKEKEENNYIIHAPHLHTRQKDLFGGYAICKQNGEAVATSSEIALYYERTSKGSVFDLGVAYALRKKLVLLNEHEIKFNDNDLIDNIIKSWPYNKKELKKELIK